MKNFIITGIFVFAISLNLQSQQLVKFIFNNNCSLTKPDIDFNVIPAENTQDYHYSISKTRKEKQNTKKNHRYLFPGKYIVKSVIKKNDYKINFEDTVIIENTTTKVRINIPKLKIRTSLKRDDLNSFKNYKNYYYCNELCNGKYVDFYNKNKKRIEGEFVNGKPVKLITYNKYDNSRVVSYFNNEWQPLKIEKYNNNEELFETITYKYTKRKIIVKKYNIDNKLIETNKYNKF